MSDLESDLELAVVTCAKQNGWKVVKLGGDHTTGLPDRMFVGRKRVVFIEFKRPGQKPRKIQSIMIESMRKGGLTVHVIDNFDDGVKALGIK